MESKKTVTEVKSQSSSASFSATQVTGSGAQLNSELASSAAFSHSETAEQSLSTSLSS